MFDFNALRQVSVFKELADDELQWIVEHSTEIWLQPEELHRAEGDPADYVFVLVDGEIRITQTVGEQEVLLVTYGPHTLFGELPILLGQTQFWAAGRALTACHILEIPKEVFWQILTTYPKVTTSILKTMAERVQELQTFSQQREKLVALGTLAAGLAHELNNPASASRRAAKQLQETFQILQSLTFELGQKSANPQEQQLLLDLQQEAIARAATPSQLNPLAQSDREDEVADWLEDHNVANGWKLAPTLAGAGLDIEWLDNVVDQVTAADLSLIMQWLEATLTAIGLMNVLNQGTERISQLVQSVKDYSYMDQAPLQEVDIHEGLDSTLTILGHKLKHGVAVTREYDRSLPRICAHGSELNQVWTNLIDNAIDAMNGKGEITVRTARENNCMFVEIADNGAGIPPEVQPRIFEPFFTTKEVGKGTGLGLHIAYRIIVGQHEGDIRVTSQPGETRFQIRLPIKSS